MDINYISYLANYEINQSVYNRKWPEMADVLISRPIYYFFITIEEIGFLFSKYKIGNL